MATITKEHCRVAYTISGNSPEVRYFPESYGRSHKAGAMLAISASGRLVPLPTASGISSAATGGVLRGICGLALQDGGTYTNSTTMVPVAMANDDTVFEANIAHRQTAASGTLGYTMIGSVAGASCNSSRFYVAKGFAAATNSILTIRGIAPGSAINDLYGRVYFQFLRTARAFR